MRTVSWIILVHYHRKNIARPKYTVKKGLNRKLMNPYRLGFGVPLGLYGAWLPMRMYGSGGTSGVPMLPAHTSASYPSHQDLYQSRLSQHLGPGANHLQGAAYPTGCQRTPNHRCSTSFTDSEDDGSIDSPASPAHDLSKSRHGESLDNWIGYIIISIRLSYCCY